LVTSEAELAKCHGLLVEVRAVDPPCATQAWVQLGFTIDGTPKVEFVTEAPHIVEPLPETPEPELGQ
jgi:hypothetical protein